MNTKELVKALEDCRYTILMESQCECAFHCRMREDGQDLAEDDDEPYGCWSGAALYIEDPQTGHRFRMAQMDTNGILTSCDPDISDGELASVLSGEDDCFLGDIYRLLKEAAIHNRYNLHWQRKRSAIESTLSSNGYRFAVWYANSHTADRPSLALCRSEEDFELADEYCDPDHDFDMKRISLREYATLLTHPEPGMETLPARPAFDPSHLLLAD